MIHPFRKAPTWRVISTRHPPIDLFERVASREDFEDLLALEAAFSPHCNEILILQGGLPKEEWALGPGAGYVMAPFVYRGPSRFSDGSFGAYYAGLEEETAAEEVAFHHGRFLAMTPGLVAHDTQHQVLRAQVTADLEDIRGLAAERPDLYAPDPAAYGPVQAFAAAKRAGGSDGIAYDSVRNPGGGCVAIFRPRAVSDCRQVRLLAYHWDGTRITGWTRLAARRK